MRKKSNGRINTPFGYFGSKSRIALQLCKELPPHNCWVEGFCGSAALTLAKPQAPIEVINDIDNEIVNFFQQLRENTSELCRVVSLTPYAREELLKARNNDKPLDSLERARLFLIESMMAINGVFGEERGGFSYSQSYSRSGRDARVNRWYNLPERLALVAERLRSVRVENRDAKEIVNMFHNRPATLIYLDPPYFADRTNGYKIDANDEIFHRELLMAAKEAKCMIFISGYDNKLYNEMLSSDEGWATTKIETTTRDSLGRSHSRTEVVWMNESFQNALDRNRVPIRLSAQEKKQQKLNPARV